MMVYISKMPPSPAWREVKSSRKRNKIEGKPLWIDAAKAVVLLVDRSTFTNSDRQQVF